MSNMSYCRFENTVPDLDDCYDALGEISELSDLGEDEKRAAIALINISELIVSEYGHLLNE